MSTGNIPLLRPKKKKKGPTLDRPFIPVEKGSWTRSPTLVPPVSTLSSPTHTVPTSVYVHGGTGWGPETLDGKRALVGTHPRTQNKGKRNQKDSSPCNPSTPTLPPSGSRDVHERSRPFKGEQGNSRGRSPLSVDTPPSREDEGTPEEKEEKRT